MYVRPSALSALSFAIESARKFEYPADRTLSYTLREHRVGSLTLRDVSVAIAVAHPRRAGAFDAARYVIEQIKIRLPIWKLEHYADGSREWVDPTRTARPVEQPPHVAEVVG